MRPYQYTPLGENEIRLASLHPSCFGTPLCITIKHMSNFSKGESYEALSYVWGNSETKHSLYCKNNTNLAITPNLRAALLALRLQDTPRLLWIDAICIDQNNIAERNSQVSLMRDIYREAKRTVIYLGDKTEDSFFAASFLTKLFHRCWLDTEIETIKDLAEKKPVRKYLALDAARKLGSSRTELFGAYPPEITQRAIVNLLARPWFQRVWVIQEFAVSKDVLMLVGSDEIEWASFILAFGHAFPTAGLTWRDFGSSATLREFYMGLSQMLQMQELRQEIRDSEGGRRRLMVLLSKFREARATKGCDKIYALLGLSRDILGFFPNYNFSDQMSFTYLAITCIQRGGSDAEDLLYEACVSNERSGKIPSWVPDWRFTPKRRSLGHSMTGEGTDITWFHAGRPTEAYYPKPYLETNILKLITRGILLDTVIVLGHPQATSDGSSLYVEHLLHILQTMQIFKMICASYPSGQNIDKVLARILEANQPRDENHVTSFREYNSVRDIQLDMLIEHDEYIADFYPLTLAEIRRLYKEEPHGLRNAARAIAGRVFGFTDRFYAGLLPSNTRHGDRICVLQGLRVPFVLRKGIEGCWTLVGDAYVDGMMFGEMVDSESSFQEIRIL